MRAVVTGGAGFLGSHLIEYLISKNYEVICLDRKGCNKDYMDSLGINVTECDVLKPDAASEHIQKGDYVFHLAAYLGKAKVTREEYFALNVNSAAYICKSAVDKKAAAFIFPSSLAAMGPSGTPEKPMNEDTECLPATSYGQTKLEAEKRIKSVAGDKINTLIFRPPPFFGPGMNPITSSYILFSKMMEKSIAIVGDGENYFPLCYVKNLAHAMLDMAEAGTGGIETFILADGVPVKFNDILFALRKEFGVNKKIIHIPYRFAYSTASFFEFLGNTFKFTPLLTTDIVIGMSKSVYYYDISKAVNAGYKPAYTLEEGIKETVKWMREKK